MGSFGVYGIQGVRERFTGREKFMRLCDESRRRVYRAVTVRCYTIATRYRLCTLCNPAPSIAPLMTHADYSVPVCLVVTYN